MRIKELREDNDIKQREIAEQYKKAGRTLVGNSLDDMVTHEMGHHISYSLSDVNKKLSVLRLTVSFII